MILSRGFSIELLNSDPLQSSTGGFQESGVQKTKCRRQTVEVCAGTLAYSHGLDYREGGGQSVDSAVRQCSQPHTPFQCQVKLDCNHCSLYSSLCAALWPYRNTHPYIQRWGKCLYHFALWWHSEVWQCWDDLQTPAHRREIFSNRKHTHTNTGSPLWPLFDPQ